MKVQDIERTRLWPRRPEILVPALDALVIGVVLVVLRPTLQLAASDLVLTGLLHDPFLLTWTFMGALSAMALLIWSQRAGHYNRRRPRWHEFGDLTGWVLLLGVIDVVISAIGSVDARIPVGTWLLIGLSVPLARLLVRRRLDAIGLWRRPTVIVGVGANAERAAEALLRDQSLGLAVIAFADPVEGRVLASGGIRPLPRMIEVAGQHRPVLPLDRLLAGGESGHNPPHVVIAPDPVEMPACALLFERLAVADHDVDFLPPFGSLLAAEVKISRLPGAGGASMRLSERLKAPLARAYKRGFDLVVGTAICVFTAPLILAIAAAILLIDGRPVFFFQERIGMAGRRFPCLKFRTMLPDAEARLQAVLESDAAARAEWQRAHKLRNDPRISRVGRWLRRTSLDELPQLFNVVRGDMSLIGPRPVVEDELHRYGPRAAFYLKTRPGLSGLWQVSGRNDVDYGHRVHLDCHYIRNWSPWWDCALLFATVRVVLTGRGAY